MQIWPAIDLRGGKCVRLRQGDYAQETVFNDDPVAVALSFFALAALKLAGAGGFAAAGWVSIMLACLLAGLGFSSWFFEDREIRR